MNGRRVAALLGLILLVGTLARVPGLFWGYRLHGAEHAYLHPDEPLYSLGRHRDTGFPRGLEVQVRLVTRALDSLGLGFLAASPAYDFLVGRVVSLVYGLLTVLVLFRLARAVFRDDRVGLAAALLLALADLHVTYSHLGVPDSAATFWFTAGLAAAHAALARGRRASLLAGALCVGVTGALRFQFAGALPLAWAALRSRRRLVDVPLALVTTGVAFFAANGFRFNPAATRRMLAFLLAWGDLGWKKAWLPAVYLGVLTVGVGLPVVLLAAYGLARCLHAKRDLLVRPRALLGDPDLPLVLAPVVAFVQMSTVGLWAARHAIVLIPCVAMLGAAGLVRLADRLAGRVPAITAGRLAAAVALYLAVQVASVQAYFVDDPLERAGRWLRVRVPAGEPIASTAKLPREYPRAADWNANYLVITAQAYGRYFSQDFRRVDDPDHMADPARVWGGDAVLAERLRRLFRGELPYRLVKTISPHFYTPELALTRAFWYPPPHVHEVRIYERRRAPSRELAVLTPTRADYVVTLDAGRLWRPDPGQDVAVEVSGQPLGGTIQAGPNLLVVPRELVRLPASVLRVASSRPLPLLAPAPLRRIRPVGESFAVEAFVDEDLMPEGFHPPEIGADGAVWRWSGGVGRVLLPSAGLGGPWQALALRLHGRQAGPAPQPVVFFLDGRKVGEALVDGEPRIVELALPPAVGSDRLASLEIVTRPWRQADVVGGEDTRLLGVAVYWVRVSRHPGSRAESGARAATPGWRPLFGLAPTARVEPVEFMSGGLTLRGDLYAPDRPGRSVVLLAHGASALGRRHGLYLALATRLAVRGHWVLNADFRGYGDSQDPPQVVQPRDLDFTEDLLSALAFLERRLGRREVTVVGHSFGAGVALAAAARDPRVTRVVAVSPGRRALERVLGSDEGRRMIRDRMAAEMGLRADGLPLDVVDGVVRPIVIDSYAGHRFRQPVLLVDGGREEAADLQFLRETFERMRGPRAYLTLPDADHYFGIVNRVEARDPVTLDTLADVVDGWIRDGARWARRED